MQQTPPDAHPRNATPDFGADDRTLGTRQHPVVIKTGDDIALATSTINQDHSHAQGEANNIQRGHAVWEGFPITFEAPAGGIRRGVAPDGTPWEQSFTAAYGYVRGTEGADGDKIDVYFGPFIDVAVEAYVINELDRDTGKFKQTKSFVGFQTEDEVRAAYLGSSGKTEAQIGDIAAIPVDELKAWWRDGNHKKPFPMPKAVNKAFTPPKAKGPLSLLQFIASRGGLRPDPGGELKGLGFNNKSRVVIPGLGFRSVMRKDGMDLDQAREAAVEAGYLQDAGSEQQRAR